MHPRLLGFALVALLAPALIGAGADSPDYEAPADGEAGRPPEGGTDGMPEGDVLSDGQIVGILSTANQGELATGEQAQRKGESQAVRDFGARMVAEHSALEDGLLALANQLGVTPEPSKVSEWLAGMAEHIRTETEPFTGKAYDVAYIDGQLFLHASVVGLGDWLSTEAESPELRAAIVAALPGILGHLRDATGVREGLGDPPETFR